MSRWGQAFGELLQQQSAALLPLVTLISAAGILLCSIAVVAIIIDRSVVLRRRRVMPDGFLAQIRRFWYRGDIDAALECCETYSAAIARIVRAGLAHHRASIGEIEKALETAGQIEATALSKNVRGLGVVANLAPMLGFLGTVTGMIKAFNAIALAGTSNPSLVASGISEALLTTAAGLLVGIPSLALFHFFRGRVERFIAEMEEVGIELLEELTSQQRRRRRSEEQADAL